MLHYFNNVKSKKNTKKLIQYNHMTRKKKNEM